MCIRSRSIANIGHLYDFLDIQLSFRLCYFHSGYFVGSNVSYYVDTGDGTIYNISNNFETNSLNSSNYTVFGLYNCDYDFNFCLSVLIFKHNFKKLFQMTAVKDGKVTKSC